MAEVEHLAFQFIMAGFLLTLALLPLRYRLAPASDAGVSRRQYELMTTALLFYPAMITGGALRAPDAPSFVAGVLGVAGLVVVALLWIANTRTTEGTDRHRSRNVALFTLGLTLAGLLLTDAFGGYYQRHQPQYGVSRVLTVALLTYAMVRHQLLGIDLHLKWTLNRTLLAGVFLAVLFVVAQVAQNWLNDSYGWAAGGLTAGLLLFAFHPIQRMAERISKRAMPAAQPIQDWSHTRRAGVYRENVAIAWSDGIFDRKERIMLNHLRDRLGLSVDEAGRVEQEVLQTETGRGPRPETAASSS